MGDESLLTAEELAALLGVASDWILRGARAGEIPGYRLGRRWRFDSNQVAAWLELQGNRAVQTPEAPAARRVLAWPRPGAAMPEPAVDLATAVPADAVAEEFGVPVERVKGWIPSLLPGVHAGRSWLVDAQALEQWRRIIADNPHIARLEPGRLRTWAIREAIEQHLLARIGVSLVVRSFQNTGGRVPTWAEVMPRV